MAQSVNLWGATYSDVPAIEVPKNGGGMASFTDVTDTTAIASDVLSGKYFYTAAGEKTLGTGSGGGGYVTQDQDGYLVLPPTGGGGGPTLITKSITLNGTYDADDDNADGYSEVTVNVQGGASVTETQGTYGTEVIVTSGNAPSATSHTIYFEFADETDETIIGYWNGTFISDAVTATTPTTYDSKTVTLAQLDGVTWYSYTPPTPPTPGQWETVFTGNIAPNPDTPYNYFWISDLSNVYPTAGSVWRITVDNTEYICTAATASTSIGNYVCIGNPKYSGGTDNGSNAPFNFMNAGWGAWTGDTELISDGVTVYAVKIEQQVE